MLRTTALATALLLSCALARAQASDDAISTYFSKYVDDERFTVVYVSGKMFDLMESVVANLDTEDMTAEQSQALRDVVVDMRSLRILSTSDSTLTDLYPEAKAKLLTAQPYEVLMTVRDKGETNVDFYVHETGGELVDDQLLHDAAERAEGARSSR